ncbi:MAG: metallophosphoesterase [Paludibacteraceae bacterium]|nr:metallophosphoesterase [Paludibacteraceae bacterium]
MDTLKRKLVGSSIVLMFVALQSCNLLPTFDPLNFIRAKSTVNERFVDSETTNATHPIPNVIVATDTYQFIAVSDIHITDYSDNLAQVFAVAETDNTDFLLLVGDICNGRTKQLEAAKKQVEAWDKKPCYYVAGNHDLFFSWEEYLTHFGSSSYTFEVETSARKDLFIAIESASGTFGAKQTAWLKRQVANRHLYRHCIIFTHTNFFARPFDTNGIYTKEERISLLSLFSSFDVTMVITGHAHKEHRTVLGNVLYITLPALENGGSIRFDVGNEIQASTIVP